MAAWAVPFLSFASAAHPWTPDIEVTRRHQLPELAPNAAVEVYAMDKPLSGLPIPLMEATQGWHSGLAFRSGSSFWYLEYYAKDGMKSAVLPEIDGSSLVWNNTAILGLKMNTSVQIEAYWTRALFLGVVNGSVYNAWCCWAATYGRTYPSYELFNVLDGWPASVTYIFATTCVDFVHRAIQVFQTLGANFRPLMAYKHDWVNLYAVQRPLEVNMSDYAERMSVLEWYKVVLGQADSVQSWLLMLPNFLKDRGIEHVFLRSEGKYWKIMLNASHPFGFDFAEDHRIAWPNNRTLAADLEVGCDASIVHPEYLKDASSAGVLLPW
eukprot:CAMPEP_0182821012 /NCGR_PEP_ID=MMETSP0006_2-20121128/13434_1 /TAXON_ID=97485 /ORGANISM="Prymnesium parvum, Strain Texoma1" /LENGTH=323 /DNA_ID=CAMNT_0024947723 /DNA_START=31 /DNA_END=999 /DNA_ORIENTATION=-